MTDENQFNNRTAGEPLQPKQFRILIVDDEGQLRTLIKQVLTTFGYERIDEAEDGEQAIELLKAHQFDAVLLDKNLPGKDGLEVLREAKPHQTHCEFIMITGYGSLEAALDAIELEIAGFLTKPLNDLNVLKSTLERALRRVQRRKNRDATLEELRNTIAALRATRENPNQ